MHPAIQGLLSRSGGLITRAEALDLGLSPSAIKALVRQQSWVIVRRGVYADAEVWNALDEHRGRPLLRARAATLLMQRSWVLSHDSSAHAHGLDILDPIEPFVHVTRPGFTNAWTKAGVKHHLARYRPEQVTETGGLRCLDLGRTAVDIARERDEDHGLAALDSAMRMGVPRQALSDAAEVMKSWPNTVRVRAGIELADPGAQSVAESLGRRLVWELGIGVPETQFPLYLGERIAWCDLIVGRHVFEIDGRVKYLPRAAGGLAHGDPHQVLWDEKKRQRLIAAEQLGVSRILWADFWGPARAAARARLLADVAVTEQRFGTRLPEHLERNAAEIRARYSS